MMIILSCLLFLLFFVWGTNGDITLPLTVYAPYFHLLLLFGFSVALLLYVFRSRVTLPEKGSTALFFSIPPAAGIVTALISLFVFKQIPHVQDAIHYHLMARQFAEGKMFIPAHPYDAFLDYIFLIPFPQGVVSLFPPGFPLFLVPFVWLHLSWLASPIATAAAVFLVGDIAYTMLRNRNIAVLSMVIALFSPFLMIMGGTYMSHPFCAVLTLGVVRLLLAIQKKHSFRLFSIVGLLIGWCLLTRPYNAVIVSVFTVLFTLFALPRKKLFNAGLYLFAGFLPFFLLLLWYNRFYTGHPFEMLQSLFFNATEPVKECHQPGFGKGCPFTNAFAIDPSGFSFRNALFVSYERLRQLLLQLFVHPLALLFVALSPVVAATQAEKKTVIITTSLFLLTFTAYFFFYFNGNAYGPRYYYEAAWLLPIPVAITIRKVWQLRGNASWHFYLFLIVFSFLNATIFMEFRYILPPLLKNYHNDYWLVGTGLRDTLEKAGIKHGLIFMENSRYKYDALYGNAFIAMDRLHPESGNIVAHNMGPEANSQLMHRFPDRKTFVAIKAENNRWSLFSLPNRYPAQDILIQPEFNRLTVKKRHNPDFCNIYPVISTAQPYIPIPNNALPPKENGLLCRFGSPQQRYELLQDIPFSGKVNGTVSLVTGPNMGVFTLKINGKQVGVIDAYASRYATKEIPFSAFVRRGVNTITITPTETKETFFIIDFMRLQGVRHHE